MLPPMCRRLLAPLLTCVLLGCTNSGSRATEQLNALQKKKEAEGKAREEAKQKQQSPSPVAQLEPPYDDTQATFIIPEGPCPDGLWALFPGDAPGATSEEKKANAQRRAEFAQAARARKYLVRLRAPDQVVLSPYDAPRGKFNIDVNGSIDCTDGLGRITLAWTTVKAQDPGNSAAKEGSDFAVNIWMAQPAHFELPITSLVEAKEFENKNRFALWARVAFGLGKVDVDRRIRKVAKVTEKVGEETLSIGGGNEDWGAGRLVRAELLGIRVSTEGEKKQLLEKKGGQ